LCGIGVQAPSRTVNTVSECLQSADSTSEVCAASDPVAPAAEAGMLPGDRIVSIDGAAMSGWTQVTSVIRESPGKALTIVVERGGELVTLTATPALSESYVLADDGTDLLDADGNYETTM